MAQASQPVVKVVSYMGIAEVVLACRDKRVVSVFPYILSTVYYLLFLAFTLALAPQALARTPDRVLLIINEQSKISREIGDYYVTKRGIKHILAIKAPEEEEISRELFEKAIKLPISQYLAGNGLQDEILYIVTTKGVPLKIQGSGGRGADRASVDSELTLLYREMIYGPYERKGRIRNPYFGSGRPFDHKLYDIYLVTRLTGFDLADVKALIDRAGQAKGGGNFLLDLSSDDYKPGNNWLREAAKRLRQKGFATLLETSEKFLTGKPVPSQSSGQALSPEGLVLSPEGKELMGYASWGSNDPKYPGRELGYTFLPGALAVTFVSTDGRTFEKPPDDWKPGNAFAGSKQSLMADLIHQGAAGAAGNVYEPFLDAVVRPDILFPAYVSGFNLAESFYMAIPYLSWQTTVVGDPLLSPFSKDQEARPARPDPDKSRERAGGKEESPPLTYSNGRKQLYASLLKAPPSAKGHLLLARVYLSQGFPDRARAELEKALALDPKFEPAYYELASLFAGMGDRQNVGKVYLSLLNLRPDNPLALNNLAWQYVQEGKNLPRAKEMAEKAVSLKPTESGFQHTLAWVYLKLDLTDLAIQKFSQAVALNPNNPVYRYHLGLAYLKKAEKARPEGLLPKDHPEGLVPKDQPEGSILRELKEKAVAEMKKALEFSSTFPEAEEARKTIKDLTVPSRKGKIRLGR